MRKASVHVQEMYLNPITEPVGAAICFKHDKVIEMLGDIAAITDAAKRDGKRMEAGLRRKSKRIEELQRKLDLHKSLVRVLRKRLNTVEKALNAKRTTA